MATLYGSVYPVLEEGLIFCFDPKNRECWNGEDIIYSNDPGTANTIGSIDPLFLADNNDIGTALTKKGYFTYDATDCIIETTFNTYTPYNLRDNFTVSAWIYLDTLGQLQSFFGRYDAAGDENFYFGITNASNFLLGVGDAGSTAIAHGISINTWYNVTISRNDTANSVYTNAVLKGIFSSNWTSNIELNSPCIGGWNEDGASFQKHWVGRLGPISVYNRTLSLPEIQTNYNILKGRFSN